MGDLFASVFYQQNNTLPEDFYNDLPEPYRYDVKTLLDLKMNSVSPGNFAKRLCMRIWPELYGPDNLRLKYSYYGGGPLGKIAMDDRRKCYLRKYVIQFFPHCAVDGVWKGTIVSKINESLRRPVKNLEAKCQ